MKQSVFIITSVVLHAGFMIALAADTPSDTSGAPAASPVHVRIVGKPLPRAAAPAPKPRPVPPQEKAKVAVKEPVVKKEPLPEPSADHIPPLSEAQEDVAEGNAEDQAGSELVEGAVSNGAGLSGMPSENQARAAELDVRSFVKPRYTLPARKAEYKASFVAEVLVGRDGRAKDVRFDREILYGMDERIIQAIKRANFKPATNRIGMVVESWVRIPFQLAMND